MIAYLDTNVAIWLGQGTLSRLTAKAQRLVEDADVVISPMVLLEMEYLSEIGRLKVSSRDLQIKLESEIGARVCALPFRQSHGWLWRKGGRVMPSTASSSPMPRQTASPT